MYTNELYLYTEAFGDQPQSYGEEVGSSEWLYEQQYTMPQQNDSMGQVFYWSFPEVREAGSNFFIGHTDASTVVEQSVGGHSLELSFDYSDYPTSTPSSIHSPLTPTTFTSYTLADALILPPTPPRKTQIHEDTSEVRSSRDIDTADANNFTAEPSETGRHVQPPSTDSEPVSRPSSIGSSRRSRNTRRVLATPYTPPQTRKKVEYVYPVIPPLSSADTNITPPPSPKSAQPPVNVPREPTSFVQPKSSDSPTTLAPPPYTGDWETDAIATTYYLQSAAITDKQVPSFSIPPLPALPLPSQLVDRTTAASIGRSVTRRGEHTTEQRQQQSGSDAVSPSSCPEPTPDHAPRSASPGPNVLHSNRSRRRRAKPQPKSFRDQDGRPILACLFCRGRKIACGPPPDANAGPSCNQCLRRGLACVYPKESRRGMRTKKSVDAVRRAVSSSSASSSSASPVESTPVKNVDTDNDMDLSDASGSEWDGDE